MNRVLYEDKTMSQRRRKLRARLNPLNLTTIYTTSFENIEQHRRKSQFNSGFSNEMPPPRLLDGGGEKKRKIKVRRKVVTESIKYSAS